MLIWHDVIDEPAPVAAWISQGLEGAEIVTSLDQAETAIARDPEGLLVALVSPPEHVLARALSRQQPPDEALRIWGDGAQCLLDLVRRNRRRIRLIDSAMAVARPRALADLLSISDAAFLARVPEAGPEQDPVLLLLATHCLRHDPDARKMADELAASMVNLSGDVAQAPDTATNAFVSYHLRQQDIIESKALDARVRAQLETALAQNLQALTESRSELEQARGLLGEQEVQIAGLTDENKRYACSVELLSQQNQAMVGEMEALHATHIQLNQRLKQINEGLESSQVQAGDLAQQLRQSETRLLRRNDEISGLQKDVELAQTQRAAIEAELHRVMSSRSIRMTAPMRQFGNLLRRLRGRKA
jgi:predicted nuclease with TOPRIM domain